MPPSPLDLLSFDDFSQISRLEVARQSERVAEQVIAKADQLFDRGAETPRLIVRLRCAMETIGTIVGVRMHLEEAGWSIAEGNNGGEIIALPQRRIVRANAHYPRLGHTEGILKGAVDAGGLVTVEGLKIPLPRGEDSYGWLMSTGN